MCLSLIVSTPLHSPPPRPVINAAPSVTASCQLIFVLRRALLRHPDAIVSGSGTSCYDCFVSVSGISCPLSKQHKNGSPVTSSNAVEQHPAGNTSPHTAQVSISVNSSVIIVWFHPLTLVGHPCFARCRVTDEIVTWKRRALPTCVGVARFMRHPRSATSNFDQH